MLHRVKSGPKEEEGEEATRKGHEDAVDHDTAW